MKRSREEAGVDAAGTAPAAKKSAVESTAAGAPSGPAATAAAPGAQDPAPTMSSLDANATAAAEGAVPAAHAPVASEATAASAAGNAASAPGVDDAPQAPTAASGGSISGDASATAAGPPSSNGPALAAAAAAAGADGGAAPALANGVVPAPAAPLPSQAPDTQPTPAPQGVASGAPTGGHAAQLGNAAVPGQPGPPSPAQSAPAVAGQPSPSQPQQQGKLKVEDALAYLAKVKGEFQDDPENPHIYNLFLDIMKNFKSQQIDTPGVISQVSQLFRGHDHLILGFNTFLPPDQKISKEQLRIMNEQHQAMKEKKAAADKGTGDGKKSKKPKKQKKQTQSVQMQNNLMQQTGSQVQAQTQGQGGGGQPPFGFEHAITYVTKIKTRFERDSAKYTRFLDILHDYKEDKQSIEGVLEQVSELFKDHPDLLKEFAYFLPEAVQEQATARLAQAAASHQSNKKRRGKGKGAKVGKDDKLARAKKKQKIKKGQLPVDDMNAGMHPGMMHGGMHPGMMGQHPGMMGQHPGMMGQHPGMMMQGGAYGHHPAMYTPHAGVGAPASAPAAAPAEPKPPPKLPLIEKKFFQRVKQALGQESLWTEFLKCLELYAHDLLSRVELLSLLTDIVAVCPDGGEDLIDELEAVLVARGDKSDSSANQEYWLSMPTTEIDFSQCRRCTPSYRALPHNYPRGTCTGRTSLCESVLNNNWVSVPTGSEDFGAKNQRRNQYEEALFKCEDDRYEMDMVMDANRSAIKALEPIALAIKALEEQGKKDHAAAQSAVDSGGASTSSNGAKDSKNGGSSKKYQYRLDKRALSVMHLKAIARVYGDAGDRVLELLRKNPAGAIPVILSRLKQKAVEWGKARQQLDKQWKEVLEKNYQKSLDHRSFYFKTHDRKAVMSKTLLQEAKVAKRRADAKKSKTGLTISPSAAVSDANITSVNKVADAASGGSGASANGSQAEGALAIDMSTSKQTSMASSEDGAAIVASSHLTFAMPDVEAHRDVWALMQFAANKTGGSGQAARFSTEESRDKLSQFIREILHPLLGADVPAAWVDAAPGTSVGGAKLAPALKKGTAVSTPYGDGKISEMYADDSLACVEIPSGPCFIASSNLLKPGAAAPDRYAANDSNKTSVLLIGNNKLYVFVRLYIMVYNRLRRAKELCRRASSQKRPIVRHWKDRVATPRSPDNRASPSGPKDATGMDLMNVDSGAQGTSSSSSPSASASAASPTAMSNPSESAVTPAAAQTTDEDAALKSQIRSGKTYREFLGHVLDLMSGKIENAAFEDICRTLMGASTASYMMFTLDKLLSALMKQAAVICEESESESTSKLQMLFKKEKDEMNAVEASASSSSKGKKGSKKKSKASRASKAKKTGKSASRYKARALKVPYDKSNLPDNLFRVQFVPGHVRKTPAKAGSHGPGLWDETMVWEVQPQVCFELIGETSKLRNEVTLDASVVGPQVYAERYLMESGSTGFGGHILGGSSDSSSATASSSSSASNASAGGPKGGNLFLNRNKVQVKKYLEKQGSLGYEDKDTGRDRRARDQLNLLRHSLQWGLGTIRTSDGLAAASSIETDKLRFVAGSEDFMYRVTIEYQDSGNKDSQSSSSSAEDAEDIEMADADGDNQAKSIAEVSSKSAAASSKGSEADENAVADATAKSAEKFNAFLAEKTGEKR